jgi:hypothetical protein
VKKVIGLFEEASVPEPSEVFVSRVIRLTVGEDRQAEEAVSLWEALWENIFTVCQVGCTAALLLFVYANKDTSSLQLQPSDVELVTAFQESGSVDDLAIVLGVPLERW